MKSGGNQAQIEAAYTSAVTRIQLKQMTISRTLKSFPREVVVFYSAIYANAIGQFGGENLPSELEKVLFSQKIL